jgi:sugar phosphate isomerase/epimerase
VRPKGEVLPERAADDMPRYAEILQKHKKRMMLLTTGITGVASPNAETILRTAKKLGIQYYRLGYWKQVPVDKIQAQLRELAALNRDIGVCALFQNHSSGKGRGSGYAGGNLTEMYDIIKDLPPDQIGVAFDLGHALLTHGDDWPAHFERLKPWFKIAYVKDSKRPDGFVPFGEGEFGKTDFLHRLRQMNYRAPLSVHIEFPWSPKDRATLVKTLTDSQRIVRQWLSRA